MNQTIKEALNLGKEMSPDTLWEFLKMKIRNTGKSYARTKASDTEFIVAHLSE